MTVDQVLFANEQDLIQVPRQTRLLGLWLGWSDQKTIRLMSHILILDYENEINGKRRRITGLQFLNTSFNRHPGWCLEEIEKIQKRVEGMGTRTLLPQALYWSGEPKPIVEWFRK